MLLPSLAALLAIAAALPAQRYEDLELYAPGGRPYDQFGSDVALSDDYALVGHSRDDDLGLDSGSVWLFGLHPWVSPPQRHLLASDGRTGDQFGSAVAIDGDVAVVGAPSADSPHADSGAAYVYRRDPLLGDWVEQIKLDPMISVTGDRTGADVAVSGELIVLGAPGQDQSGSESGLAYAYRYDSLAGVWNYEGWLLPGDGDIDDHFGSAVAADGDLAVIGAYGDDDKGSSSGSVYVFRYVSGFNFWIQEAKLLASDGAAGDIFGWSVAVSGDTIAVGAPSDDDLGARSGSVYLYRYDSGTYQWVEDAKLLPAGGLADDQFGRSVAISGDELLAGSPGAAAGASGHGTATWFRRAPGSGLWVEQAQVTDSSPQVTEQQGEHVALRGDRGLVAAPNDRDKGIEAGSAALFRRLAFRLYSQPMPPVAGQPVLVDVFEGVPSTLTWMSYSTTGIGSYPIAALGLELNLDSPGQAGPARVSDAAGNVSWVFNIPLSMAGRAVWAQALQARHKTEVLAVVIQ